MDGGVEGLVAHSGCKEEQGIDDRRREGRRERWSKRQEGKRGIAA